MVSMSATEKKYLLVLIIFAVLLAFWKLGGSPLMEWDESRNGVTAIEMRENGDYLNPYYGGRPDDWSVKPPLFIWTLVASFELFGQTAFALRFPSAIASIISLVWIFLIVRLYRSAHFALLVGLVLLSTRAFLGPHVGRSGDYDALLISFLLGGLYFFLRYFDFRYTKGIYWSGLFWGLAFWVKGPAALILFPGLFLYVIGNKRLVSQLKNLRFWAGLGIFLGLIASWALALYFYGATFSTGIYEGSNAFQRIFLNDILARFTDSNFEQGSSPQSSDYGFVFKYLDSRFNLWCYLFYLAVLLLIIKGRKRASNVNVVIQKHPLLFLSCCLWLSTAFLLTIASTKHHWYMAPVLPFIVITMIYGLRLHWHKTRYLFYPLLALCLSWQLHQLTKPASPSNSSLFLKQALSPEDNLYISNSLPKQDDLLYLHFYADQVFYLDDLSQLGNRDEVKTLFLQRSQLQEIPNYEQEWLLEGESGTYVILSRN